MNEVKAMNNELVFRFSLFYRWIDGHFFDILWPVVIVIKNLVKFGGRGWLVCAIIAACLCCVCCPLSSLLPVVAAASNCRCARCFRCRRCAAVVVARAVAVVVASVRVAVVAAAAAAAVACVVVVVVAAASVAVLLWVLLMLLPLVGYVSVAAVVARVGLTIAVVLFVSASVCLALRGAAFFLSFFVCTTHNLLTNSAQAVKLCDTHASLPNLFRTNTQATHNGRRSSKPTGRTHPRGRGGRLQQQEWQALDEGDASHHGLRS